MAACLQLKMHKGLENWEKEGPIPESIGSVIVYKVDREGSDGDEGAFTIMTKTICCDGGMVEDGGRLPVSCSWSLDGSKLLVGYAHELTMSAYDLLKQPGEYVLYDMSGEEPVESWAVPTRHAAYGNRRLRGSFSGDGESVVVTISNGCLVRLAINLS